MAYEKCPRCELNYILDGGKLCTVCHKEVCGESELDDIPEMCSECGENPAVAGGELCTICLKELTRRAAVAASEDLMLEEDPTLEIDSVSSMDEIEIDIVVDDEIDDEVFADADDFEDEEESEGEVPLIVPEDDELEEDDYGDGNSRNR